MQSIIMASDLLSFIVPQVEIIMRAKMKAKNLQKSVDQLCQPDKNLIFLIAYLSQKVVYMCINDEWLFFVIGIVAFSTLGQRRQYFVSYITRLYERIIVKKNLQPGKVGRILSDAKYFLFEAILFGKLTIIELQLKIPKVMLHLTS